MAERIRQEPSWAHRVTNANQLSNLHCSPVIWILALTLRSSKDNDRGFRAMGHPSPQSVAALPLFASFAGAQDASSDFTRRLKQADRHACPTKCYLPIDA